MYICLHNTLKLVKNSRKEKSKKKNEELPLTCVWFQNLLINFRLLFSFHIITVPKSGDKGNIVGKVKYLFWMPQFLGSSWDLIADSTLSLVHMVN